MSVGCGGCWLAGEIVMLAEAVLPLPPSTEVTALVVSFCVPVAVPETFTAKLQEAPPVRVAAERLTLPDPAVAAMAPLPQLPVNPSGVATSKPLGNVSVKPIPVSDEPALGLANWNVNEVIPFNAMFAAPKDIEIVGGSIITGGGVCGGPPDEPPPHPVAHQRPRIMTSQQERQRGCVGTFPVTPGDWPRSPLASGLRLDYSNN